MEHKEYDVIIIGSGAGGGVVAKELSPLCAKGARIAVLEWGPKLSKKEYTSRELEMANRLYFEGGGLLSHDGGMTIALGKAYGGSTVVYTGTSLTVEKDTIEKWDVHGIEWEDIKRRTEKYMKENNVHLLDENLINENNRLFQKGCRTLGYNVAQFPVNVRDCKGAGMCNIGCPHLAKQGTHVVQLPQAEENGVDVITNCKVESLEENACLATVKNPGFGSFSKWQEGQYRVSAGIIVVCAGALNSVALLKRSKITRRIPKLGCSLTLHPALVLAARHARSISNFYGHPKSYYSDHFAGSHRFLLETCMYFPFMAAKSMAGFGRDHGKMMAEMDKLQMILALALDEPLEGNCITTDKKGDPRVNYKLSPATRDALYHAMVASCRIFFAAGAERVHAPAARQFFIEKEDLGKLEQIISREMIKAGRISLSSAHVMGGCSMGDNPHDSVTDAWGHVHGCDWLYVADAGLFPKCSGVNPYLTIMALADRVAEGINSRLN